MIEEGICDICEQWELLDGSVIDLDEDSQTIRVLKTCSGCQLQVATGEIDPDKLPAED